MGWLFLRVREGEEKKERKTERGGGGKKSWLGVVGWVVFFLALLNSFILRWGFVFLYFVFYRGCVFFFYFVILMS